MARPAAEIEPNSRIFSSSYDLARPDPALVVEVDAHAQRRKRCGGRFLHGRWRLRSPGILPPAQPANKNDRTTVRPVCGEELFAVGEAVGLQEEAEDDRAVRRHRLVLVAGRPPDELAGAAFALVVLERALDDIGLFERGVLVQRHDGAGRELEQRGRDAVVVGVEHLDLDARKFRRLPGHIGHVEKTRGELRRILRLDVGVHDLAFCHGHGGVLHD